MLPSTFRLKKKKDFERVFNLGHASGGEFFILKQAQNNLSFTRFGFIVSAKVSAKAVNRNKLRRQVNEIVRLNLKRIKIGFDVVIIFKRLAQGKESLKLEKDLVSLFIKNKLYLRDG